MKFLLISGIAAAALLASAATVLRSHDRSFSAISAISPQEIHARANVNKLPVEDFEDRSQTYSSAK